MPFGIGTVLLGAGIATQVGGSIFGGIQAKKDAKKQARILQTEARLEREATEFELEQTERKFDRLLGQQRLQFAQSGVKLVGSPLLLLEETLRDKQETMQNLERLGVTRASRLTSQARQTKKAGQDAFIASLFSGIGGGLRSSFSTGLL